MYICQELQFTRFHAELRNDSKQGNAPRGTNVEFIQFFKPPPHLINVWPNEIPNNLTLDQCDESKLKFIHPFRFLKIAGNYKL